MSVVYVSARKCKYTWRPEEGNASSGARVAGSREPLCRCWETNSGLQQEQCLRVTTAMRKHYDRKQLGGGKGLFAVMSSITIRGEKASQELKLEQEPEGRS